MTARKRDRSEIRREANLQAAQAIRVWLGDGQSWVEDWSHEDNVRLSERLGDMIDVLEKR